MVILGIYWPLFRLDCARVRSTLICHRRTHVSTCILCVCKLLGEESAEKSLDIVGSMSGIVRDRLGMAAPAENTRALLRLTSSCLVH